MRLLTRPAPGAGEALSDPAGIPELMGPLVRFDPPRPVLVLHEGHWRRGQATCARQDDAGGWRALVTYRVQHEAGPLQYQHWRGQDEVRPDHGEELPPAPLERRVLVTASW